MHHMMRRSLQTQMRTAQAALVDELVARLKTNLQELVPSHKPWESPGLVLSLKDHADNYVIMLRTDATTVTISYNADPWNLSKGLLTHACTIPDHLPTGQRMDGALSDLTFRATATIRATWHNARVRHQAHEA